MRGPVKKVLSMPRQAVKTGWLHYVPDEEDPNFEEEKFPPKAIFTDERCHWRLCAVGSPGRGRGPPCVMGHSREVDGAVDGKVSR